MASFIDALLRTQKAERTPRDNTVNANTPLDPAKVASDSVRLEAARAKRPDVRGKKRSGSRKNQRRNLLAEAIAGRIGGEAGPAAKDRNGSNLIGAALGGGSPKL